MTGPLAFHPPFELSEFEGTTMGRCLLTGKLVATAVSPLDGRHITVRISPKAPPEGRGRWRNVGLYEATRCFVDVPAADLSRGDEVGTFDVHRSQFWVKNGDTRRVNAARYVLLAAAGRVAGEKVLQSVSCFRCGRPLTDPVSIERGMGPHCYGAVTGSLHERKGVDDHFAMQRAGERGDMEEVERLAAKLTQAEVDRLGADVVLPTREDVEPYDDPHVRATAGALEAEMMGDEDVKDEPEFVALEPGQDPRELLR